MVKVRDVSPIYIEGQMPIDDWLEKISSNVEGVDREELLRAYHLAVASQEAATAGIENTWIDGNNAAVTGLEMSLILAELHLDQETLVAALLYRVVREGRLELKEIENQFGLGVAKLIDGVQQMAAIHQRTRNTKDSVLGQDGNQADNIRRMLVAMVDDVRIALIKIAERTCAIRAVKSAPAAKRYRVAREVFDIYAPLAHRLGVGHIKWELEDLAFRYIEPRDYKKIAKLLDEKRLAREEYVRKVVEQLDAAMKESGIDAEVNGRAKHIYSIWRKMRRKKISFSQVYDIRAVRIHVPDLRDCYSALGVVHSMWRNIPKEFDDYIASPKPNGYQSLHTAVIGPEGKVVEIQIRTHKMHEDAELGVCAHWRYKGTDVKSASQSYEDKISWLRQVLEWHEEIGEDDDISADLNAEVSNDRIYVFTPDGHVVDMPSACTAVDFAYRIHTEVGHNCRGAKVNGRLVALNYKLKIGDQVEILTAKNSHPSRDWLNQDLGYVLTSRARSKVAHWFKQQDRDQNIIDGKHNVQRELQRFGLRVQDWSATLARFNFKTEDDLFAAVGAGDLRLLQIIHFVEEQESDQKITKPEIPTQASKVNKEASDDVNILGVGNLLTQIAKCCKPVPGDAITGFITVGRGVSIHRSDCVNLLALKDSEPQRIIEVSWGQKVESVYPVDLEIEAFDRTGLLRDIMVVLTNAKVNVLAANTKTDQQQGTAIIRLSVEIDGLNMLAKAMNHLDKVPNVMSVRRVTNVVRP